MNLDCANDGLVQQCIKKMGLSTGLCYHVHADNQTFTNTSDGLNPLSTCKTLLDCTNGETCVAGSCKVGIVESIRIPVPYEGKAYHFLQSSTACTSVLNCTVGETCKNGYCST